MLGQREDDDDIDEMVDGEIDPPYIPPGQEEGAPFPCF